MSDRALTAFMPSPVMGIFTTTWGSSPARTCPSAIISSAVSERTSADTGPSTIDAISLITVWKSFPSAAISDGFVVTPETNPIAFALRMASTSAVSINIFIFSLLHFPPEPPAYHNIIMILLIPFLCHSGFFN